MKTFSEIIEIIKDYKGLKKYKDVATLLQVGEKNLSLKMFRNSFPKINLRWFCEREGLDYDSLIKGEIKKLTGEVQSTNITILLSKDHQEAIDLLNNIFSKGKRETIRVILSNLRGFSRLVELESAAMEEKKEELAG